MSVIGYPAEGLLRGPALYLQRMGALVVKRAACARRDRLAVVTQLAVPIALVLTALWTGKAYVNAPNEPPLFVSMCASRRQTPVGLPACDTLQTLHPQWSSLPATCHG